MSGEFEIIRNVTIGQYIPANSIVHRLDPRAKLIAFVLLAAAISFAQTIPASLVALLGLLLVARLADIPLTYLFRGLLPSLPLIIILIVLQIAFRGYDNPEAIVFWQWGFIRITSANLHLIGVGITHLVAFIFLVSLLTTTTTTSHLTQGFESVAGPLRFVGVPVHAIALMLTIALRFVPTLAEEVDIISKAQASRCGEIGVRNPWRPDKVARARLPLIVPLFLSALRRAEELIVAMEARCYVDDARRTRLVHFRANFADLAAVVLVVAFAASIWGLNLSH